MRGRRGGLFSFNALLHFLFQRLGRGLRGRWFSRFEALGCGFKPVILALREATRAGAVIC